MTDESEDEEDVEDEASLKGGSCAVDPELFSMLKDLRKKMSKTLGLPPFVIFQDPSLEAMATTYPITLDELQNIPGVASVRQSVLAKTSLNLSARMFRKMK